VTNRGGLAHFSPPCLTHPWAHLLNACCVLNLFFFCISSTTCVFVATSYRGGSRGNNEFSFVVMKVGPGVLTLRKCVGILQLLHFSSKTIINQKGQKCRVLKNNNQVWCILATEALGKTLIEQIFSPEEQFLPSFSLCRSQERERRKIIFFFFLTGPIL